MYTRVWQWLSVILLPAQEWLIVMGEARDGQMRLWAITAPPWHRDC